MKVPLVKMKHSQTMTMDESNVKVTWHTSENIAHINININIKMKHLIADNRTITIILFEKINLPVEYLHKV